MNDDWAKGFVIQQMKLMGCDCEITFDLDDESEEVSTLVPTHTSHCRMIRIAMARMN